jgi:hypothetical protein
MLDVLNYNWIHVSTRFHIAGEKITLIDKRASPRVSKTHSQSYFLARLFTKSLQKLLISTTNLSALGKIDPIAQKYTRIYQSTNLEVEGRGEE